MDRRKETIKLGKTGSPQDIKTYDKSQLERVTITAKPMVKLVCSNFTSLCPVTSQPDHATILIHYIPNGWLVESKSLKLYLFSFRNYGSFHEDIIVTIKNDLVDLLCPSYLEVIGEFVSRGDISICPMSMFSTPEYDTLREQRMLRYMQ